jgi:hypothetical protein
VKNDFSIVFDKFTEIKEIADDGSIAMTTGRDGFNFSTIAEIGDLNPNDTVDIIGIAYVVGPLGTVQLKSGEIK